MPKVKETANRIVVHVGDLWKRYHRASPKTKRRWKFRIKDVGRLKHSELMLCKPPNGKWQTYAWSFSKGQVKKGKRKLLIYDAKAFEILQKLKIKDFLIDEDTEWFSHLKANGKELVLTNNKGIVLHNRTRRTYRNQLKIAFMEAYYCPRIHKMYGKDSIVSPRIFFLSYCFQSLILLMRFLGLFAGIVRWRVIGFYGHKKKFE